MYADGKWGKQEVRNKKSEINSKTKEDKTVNPCKRQAARKAAGAPPQRARGPAAAQPAAAPQEAEAVPAPTWSRPQGLGS